MIDDNNNISIKLYQKRYNFEIFPNNLKYKLMYPKCLDTLFRIQNNLRNKTVFKGVGTIKIVLELNYIELIPYSCSKGNIEPLKNRPRREMLPISYITYMTCTHTTGLQKCRNTLHTVLRSFFIYIS